MLAKLEPIPHTVRFTRSTALEHHLSVSPITDLTLRRNRAAAGNFELPLSDDEFDSSASENDEPRTIGHLPHPFRLPRRIALPRHSNPSIRPTPSVPLSTPSMASKFIPVFNGPISATAIEAWLGQCTDGFIIYAETKGEKSPDLKVTTQIRLVGAQMQESTMQAWWAAGRVEYLKISTYTDFEKRIRERFIPKAQKLIALRSFYLCSQGRLQFAEYAALLAEYHSAVSSTSVSITGYKQHLLFHSHSLLLLRIMAMPSFDLDTIKFDELASLMAMQWDSLIAKGPSRTSTRPTPPPTIPFSGSAGSSALPPLNETEKAHLSAAKGCWRCRKVPSDAGWVSHVGRTCPGDAANGIAPGRDFVPGPPPVKREPVGVVFLHDSGEDQPDHINRLHVGAMFDVSGDDEEQEGEYWREEITDSESD